MQTHKVSIRINTPKEEVWWIMFDDEGYRQWTSVIDPGSYFRGSWEEGAAIHFLNDEGKGVMPTVVTHRLFMFDTVMHQRPIQHDKDQREGADADLYPAFTEVAFSEFQVVTRVDTAMDSPDVNVNEVDQLFPRAPHRLKKLVRNNSASFYHCFLGDD